MKLRDEKVDIAVDGEHIEGTLVVPQALKERAPGVLFVHGWNGNQEQYLSRARAVAALGCVCLAFDLRGHERTQSQHETVTREDSLNDVLQAYRVLASCRHVDASRMALVGSSYGGYLAAIVTSMRPVRWLALRAPAIYDDDGWGIPKRKLHQHPDFADYRRRVHGPNDNRALAACAKFQGDALVVESELDTVLPHPVTANYVAALASAHSLTLRVIEGADHGLSSVEWKQTYTDLLVAWLKEITAPARGEKPRSPKAVAAAAARLPEES
jgi:pimeloyl-ACP methyl ester carboxylesterase